MCMDTFFDARVSFCTVGIWLLASFLRLRIPVAMQCQRRTIGSRSENLVFCSWRSVFRVNWLWCCTCMCSTRVVILWINEQVWLCIGCDCCEQPVPECSSQLYRDTNFDWQIRLYIYGWKFYDILHGRSLLQVLKDWCLVSGPQLKKRIEGEFPHWFVCAR